MMDFLRLREVNWFETIAFYQFRRGQHPKAEPDNSTSPRSTGQADLTDLTNHTDSEGVNGKKPNPGNLITQGPTNQVL